MRFPVVLALTIALAACGGAAPPAQTPVGATPAEPVAATGAQVTGTVVSDQPALLGAGASLVTRLLDVTRVDAEPIVVTTGSQPVTALPAEFALAYDDDQLSSDRDYAVDAQVMEGVTVKFVSIGRVPVLTKGKQSRVNIQLAQAMTSAVRDPAVELLKEYTDLEQRLGGLERFADSRIVGPEGKEVAIGWDGFADDSGVRMVRETVSNGDGSGRFTRKFAWKDGKLWVATRERDGVSVRLGWASDGSLLIKENNGSADEAAAAEAADLSKAAKEAYAIAAARKPN